MTSMKLWRRAYRTSLLRRVCAAGLVAGTVGGFAVLAPDGGAGTAVLKDWLSPFEVPNGTFSASEAITAAKSSDFIIATRYQYRGLVGAMKQANRSLEIYAYSNAVAIPAVDVGKYPASYFAKDASGRKVKSMYGNYIMDINNSGWVSTRVADCKTALQISGYDGCYYDMLGSGLLFPGYLTALPINPTTGATWTHAQWITRVSTMIQQIRQQVGRPVIANGTNNGRRYWAKPGGSRPLVRAAQTIVAELFVRLPTESPALILPSSRWRQELDMITDAEANGDTLLLETKVEVRATLAQLTRWHKLSLATYLLGANGRTRYQFTTTAYPATHWVDDSWTNVSLGSPSGRYSVLSNGLYVRNFSAGKVVVNPTSKSITLPLAKPYTTINGTRLTSLTLAPSTGEILR